MRPLTRTELSVLFCIWIAPLATAYATGSTYVALEYAGDWAVALAVLGASLYVTTSVTVNALGAVRRVRSGASGT